MRSSGVAGQSRCGLGSPDDGGCARRTCTSAEAQRRPGAPKAKARNYGEAGALRRYGPDRGLPRAYSGHNGFEAWGPPPQQARPAVVVGFPPGRLDEDFRGCRQAAIVDNGEGVDNEEQGAAIYVCDAPRVGWSAAWPRLAHLDG